MVITTKKWYFVSKFALTYCEKQFFQIFKGHNETEYFVNLLNTRYFSDLMHWNN